MNCTKINITFLNVHWGRGKNRHFQNFMISTSGRSIELIRLWLITQLWPKYRTEDGFVGGFLTNLMFLLIIAMYYIKNSTQLRPTILFTPIFLKILLLIFSQRVVTNSKNYVMLDYHLDTVTVKNVITRVIRVQIEVKRNIFAAFVENTAAPFTAAQYAMLATQKLCHLQ